MTPLGFLDDLAAMPAAFPEDGICCWAWDSTPKHVLVEGWLAPDMAPELGWANARLLRRRHEIPGHGGSREAYGVPLVQLSPAGGPAPS